MSRHQREGRPKLRLDTTEKTLLIKRSINVRYTEGTTDHNEAVSSGRETTKAFHYFPKLPLELRIKIFKHSLNTRSIHICTIGTWDDLRYQKTIFSEGGKLLPTVLQINHESRCFGLRRYTLAFLKDYLSKEIPPSLQLSPCFSKGIYVDFTKDSIVLEDKGNSGIGCIVDFTTADELMNNVLQAHL
jgi:hypothetical protein